MKFLKFCFLLPGVDFIENFFKMVRYQKMNTALSKLCAVLSNVKRQTMPTVK